MLRRHLDSAFLGGAYVFPGGAVDDHDRHADLEAVCVVGGLNETETLLRGPASAVAAQVDEGVKFLKGQGVTITEVDKARFQEATRDVPGLVADQVPPALIADIASSTSTGTCGAVFAPVLVMKRLALRGGSGRCP